MGMTTSSSTSSTTSESILRLRCVLQRVGLSRSTLYHMVAAGQFPSAVALGERAVGWRASDIDAWLASRPATYQPDIGRWRQSPASPTTE